MDIMVRGQMTMLVESMMTRKPIKIMGRLNINGVSTPPTLVVDVVNGIEVEDGSGKNFLITFMKTKGTMFVRLDKPIVQPVAEIVWISK